LRKYPPFEFENWAVNALNTVIANGDAIANRAQVGDMGIDGRIYPAAVQKVKGAGDDLFGETDRWFPVQVKQQTKDSGKVGRPDIDNFQTAMKRQKRDKGFFVAFDYSSDAKREILRASREENLEIIPVMVQEILDEEVHYRI
jgi:restriction endonuclease Mrr